MVDQPDREAAERQRGKSRDRRNSRRRAQAHVERDAVDDDVRDVDELGHRRDAETGEDADDDRDDDQRQLAGAHAARAGARRRRAKAERRALSGNARRRVHRPARSRPVARQCATAAPNSASAIA